MAIGALVSGGISLISKGIDKLIVTEKEQQEKLQEMASKAEESKSNIESLTSSIRDNVKTVNDIKDRYAELSQGVDNLSNKNISLSTSEYEEFLNLTNQLSEVFPQLNRGIDDNGNVILNLNGDVNTITSSLETLLETEKQLANQEIADNAGEYIKNTLPQLETDYNTLENLKQEYSSYKNQLEQIVGVEGVLYKHFDNLLTNPNNTTFGRDDYKKYNDLKTILSNIGIDTSKEFQRRNEADQWEYSVIEFTEEDKKAIERYYADYVTTTETEIKKSEAELARANQQLSTMASYWYTSELSLKDQSGKAIYDNLQSADLQNGIQQMLNDINWAELQVTNGWNSEQDVYDYISNNILIPLENANPEIKESVYNNIIKAFTDTTLSSNEKLELLRNLQQQLSDLGITVDLSFKIKELESDNDIIKNQLGYNKNASSAYDAKRNREIDDFVNGLEDNPRTLWLDAEIPDSVRKGTREDWENFISELSEESVIDLQVRTSTDAVDSFADIKSALSSLDDLYSQTVLKNASGDGIANGFASPDTINAVESAFGGIAEEDAKVASALEEFEDTLVKFPNDSEKAQDAINNLVTAYIDQTDILQDLTEENKEWAKAQLKAMGITNAEEVVESRLNQQIKKNIEAFGKYKESVADYSKKLSTLDNTDEGYSDALEGMRAGFEELFNSMNQFKDENGEVITVPISTEFAQNNLEDLMAAANGSTEALDRLQAAATADYIVQCGINVPSGAKEGLRSRMNSLISQIQSEIEDVEIGAQLDNTQAISSLVQLAKQAGLSSEEVKNALSSIGVEPQISYKDMEVPDLEENIKEYNGHPVFGGYKVKEYKKVKLPIVKYGKISSGTGTGAIYGGGSSNNSSGGGNGGGGGSSSEPQTFDWIETAITRAEESISRLDKVIDNTYQNWFDRNIAVGNKIKQVSNEIDLQKKAYQGYMNKANSIGLTDVYKQKVQNGTIQIEDIADENLSKKIEEYTTWYNKAIACKDAIKDLNTTLSDLAKMRFDNVVKQFEEIEQVFTDANDLIQKRLEYAEERGMIASKAYYQGMIANSKKNRQHLAKQLTRMQEELNKGVASGSIKKGSEEWYSMTQEIEKTKQAIIETDTEIQKFANDIRQIDWDIFDLGQEMISNVIDETDFLNSLIEKRDNLTDGTKSRGLTNDGIALLGTHSSNYNMYMAKNQEYAKKIKEINNQLAKDPTNQDLINQKDEYIKAQRESILAAEDEKQAMIDLARQGYDAVLANMQELIDKRKEYLNQEKSIYEYQKNISEQTKNIASLRKQLAVYENDNSEESRKKVQQLKVSIQEAEQNLKDTEYDKYISDQEEMLDKIYQDYSDAIDEKFENIDSLFKELISIVNKFDNNIQNTLYHTAQDAGYNLSEEIKGIWSGDAKLTISSFSKNFSTYATNVQKVLSSIWNKIDYMTYVSWVDYNKQSGGTTNNKVTKQHASGLKKSTSDYLAWTQENGAEIVRTKDGALLYPVTSGTTIFTSDMTDNLWNFAKNPFEFISGIPSTISYSNHRNNENNISLTIGDIRLDGVQNPEQFASQFISAMQNNSKLRKALQSGTIDLLAGKNSKRINNF